MSVMTDTALEEAIGRGDIVIDPGDPAQIKSASVDLRLGPEAFLGSGGEILDLTKQRLLAIPPGEMAIVSVLEKIAVGPQYAGHIGLRSAHARKGLALLAGPQVDPGFKGRLHVVLVNLSPVEITIAHRDPLITLVFHDLGAPVAKPYGAGKDDSYHEQDELTGAEIDDIRQHRGYAMSEIIRDMSSMSQNVGQLRESVDGYIKRTDVYLRIFIGAILALVTATIGTGIGVVVSLVG